jgi:hypothetical protein
LQFFVKGGRMSFTVGFCVTYNKISDKNSKRVTKVVFLLRLRLILRLEVEVEVETSRSDFYFSKTT